MSRIVLGLGNTVDYELQWDSGVLERLILEYGIRSDEIRDFDSVHSEREMILSVLHFFRDSTGGERFVADPSVIRQFAGRFRTKTALGGTPVRAALAMEKVGCSAFLHLTVMDEWVRRLLPAGCGYVCSAGQSASGRTDGRAVGYDEMPSGTIRDILRGRLFSFSGVYRGDLGKAPGRNYGLQHE